MSSELSVSRMKTVQVHAIRSKCGLYKDFASTCHQKYEDSVSMLLALKVSVSHTKNVKLHVIRNYFVQ